MSGWTGLTLVLGSLALSVVVYYVLTYWPQREPKDKTARAAPQHIDEKGSE